MKILLEKEAADFTRELDNSVKSEYCFLCGKKITSPCNSHVVPKFILKNIAEDGHLSYGTKIAPFDIKGLTTNTGISNAHTFRLICRDCDNNFFKDYETTSNLILFNELDDTLKNKILCEMAIKARLSHINMKLKIISINNCRTDNRLNQLRYEGKVKTPEDYEIEDHFESIEKMYESIVNNGNHFTIILNTELNYETKIATQTLFNYNYDLMGNMIFDYQLTSQVNRNCFYLMILPINGKTRVIFYVEKERYNYVIDLVNQFNELSFEDKLHFIFISLLARDEQFYISPSLSKIMKKDKKLTKFYYNTEKNIANVRRIKDFKEYNNYLLDIK